MKPEDTPTQAAGRPPLICEVCYRSQSFHELDVKRESWYCEHVAGGTLVIRDGDDGWVFRHGVDPGFHRTILAKSKRDWDLIQKDPEALKRLGEEIQWGRKLVALVHSGEISRTAAQATLAKRVREREQDEQKRRHDVDGT